MNQRANYLIQILDKIGGPLMKAVAETNPGAGDESGESDAQTIASLLGKVVETSISMNKILDLNTADAQDDSLRVALAALAGPLVGGQYKRKGEIPGDADLKRIQTALQAVLTFGDNFAPSDEHIARLKKLAADGTTIDANQVNIQYVHAFIPVVNAVGMFSFGQPEQKLVTDISNRLVKQAIEMRESLLPELSDDDQKLAELGILRALVEIYAACHSAETQRLTALKDDAQGGSMEKVWKAFDTRAAMLEALVRNILPKATGTHPAPQASQNAPQQPAASAAPPVTEPAVQPSAPIPQDHAPVQTPENPPPAPVPEQPATPPAVPQETTQQQTASAPPASGGNPMSFFSKPGGNDDAISPVQPEQPPQTPPAQPQEQPPAPPQTPERPSPPPPQEENKDDTNKGGGDNSGGNPMSFFKKSE